MAPADITGSVPATPVSLGAAAVWHVPELEGNPMPLGWALPAVTDDDLAAVGGVRLTAHQPAFLEAGEHLRHRRRLDALTRGELAGAHGPVLAQRPDRGDLREGDRHVHPLVADDAGQPQERRAQLGRQLRDRSLGRCHDS